MRQEPAREASEGLKHSCARLAADPQQIWGPQYEKVTNYLRVYLAQIRQKNEPDPTRPRYFITEARMSYRFEPVDVGR